MRNPSTDCQDPKKSIFRLNAESTYSIGGKARANGVKDDLAVQSGENWSGWHA
jgi:hypothetical protein